MEPRFGRLTAPGVAVLAASALALLLAGLILLVKFASGDAPEARPADVAPAAGRGGGMPRPPAWGAPSATKEGESWTHKDLFTYLNSRGMAWHFHETRFGADRGPAAYAKDNPTSGERMILDNYVSEDSETPNYTYVQKRPSAADARDAAGAMASAFSWGRFLFAGPEAELRPLRSVLGVP